MKVLKQPEKVWAKQFTCKGCKAVLEASVEDIKYEVSDFVAEQQQYSMDVEGDYIAVCVLCDTKNKLKNIPPIIGKEIQNL
jgi:hypothetical protein